eukprot:gene43797-biopygen63326
MQSASEYREAATDTGIRDGESVEQLRKDLEKDDSKAPALDIEGLGTKITLSNGSDMLDQFAPWFATIAFPFLLPLGTGGADFYGKARRRKAHHPRVELGEWFDHCLRRIELQFRRDNVFAFTVFNIAFRSLISKGTYPTINSRMAEGLESIRAEQWATIARVLRDGFVKEAGRTRKVAGRLDLAVKAEGLDDATRRMLRIVDTACASVPDYEQRRDVAAQDPTGMTIIPSLGVGGGEGQTCGRSSGKEFAEIITPLPPEMSRVQCPDDTFC